ncbi:AAA family ATPase [Streptomyces sp. NPDC053079]|uniref:AAA family ATPase n=1 Tax=Streptomyces sp. NPDC053079 TaxID=3365697 RepID=UPI0037D0EE92
MAGARAARSHERRRFRRPAGSATTLVTREPPDAVSALQAVLEAVLEARLTRRLTTVIDATNTEARARAQLIATAQRHDVPTVTLLVVTPLSACIERR